MLRNLFACIFVIALAATACDTGNDDGQPAPGDDTVEPAGDTLEPGDDTLEPAGDTLEPAGDTLEPGEDTVPADPNPPTIGLILTQYTAISGVMDLDCTWEDDVEVVTVEVLVDDVVVGTLDPGGRATFDSTVCPHGAHTLSLRATDAAGNATATDPVVVIFAGKGQFLTYTDGFNDGQIPGWGGVEISVPEGATTLYDEKAHVTLPEGTGVVKSYLQWRTDVSWGFGWDIGTGNCPDSGQKLAGDEKQADQWLLEVVYEDPVGAPSGMWFSHIRFLDAGNHAGESVHLNTLFLAVPKH
jgi:hypothetical protein